MKNKASLNILLVLLVALIVFHLLVITKAMPDGIIWGGGLQSDMELYVLEAISIFVTSFLVLVLLMKGDYVAFGFSDKMLNIVLWTYFLLFLLNTIGNLFATTNLERSFAVLTLIFTVLIWRILKTKHQNQ